MREGDAPECVHYIRALGPVTERTDEDDEADISAGRVLTTYRIPMYTLLKTWKISSPAPQNGSCSLEMDDWMRK